MLSLLFGKRASNVLRGAVGDQLSSDQVKVRTEVINELTGLSQHAKVEQMIGDSIQIRMGQNRIDEEMPPVNQ